MANLKLLRNKIQSVKATRRITLAMKMVAAAKFRRARLRLEQSRDYGEGVRSMMERVLRCVPDHELPPILSDRERSAVNGVLYVALTSDRGMCGALNNNIIREVRSLVAQCARDGVNGRVLPVGKKAMAAFAHEPDGVVVGSVETMGHPSPSFPNAVRIWDIVKEQLLSGTVRHAYILYPKFISAIAQRPTMISLLGDSPKEGTDRAESRLSREGKDHDAAVGGVADSEGYIFEPAASEMLPDLIDEAEQFSIFLAMLETFASEQGARMSAMDNATRNADELLDKMIRGYNRSRQANITSELTEIVSGAAAIEQG